MVKVVSSDLGKFVFEIFYFRAVNVVNSQQEPSYVRKAAAYVILLNKCLFL